MEPPPYGYFFSPFTQVLPQSARLQSPQPTANSHLNISIISTIEVLTLDHLSFKVFFNCLITPKTDFDHLLNTHHCKTCSALTEPSPWQEEAERKDSEKVALKEWWSLAKELFHWGFHCAASYFYYSYYY